MAGAEGLEPSTLGFGIRCSTIRATDLIRNPLQLQEGEGLFPSGRPNLRTRPRSQPPSFSLFSFLMGSVLSAESAVFLEFQPLRGGLLVFSPRIILPITIGTRQMNNYSHNSQSNFVSNNLIPRRKTFKILIKSIPKQRSMKIWSPRSGLNR